MNYNNREDIIRMTPLWKGERFEDGRPRVSETILQRMRDITLEEAWGPLWRHGYKYQFEGDFKMIQQDMVMVGRAVTGVMVPYRPDLNDTLLEYGHTEEGRKGYFNQWIIDMLQEDDIVVIDMFDKVFQGTFVGGNLSTAIATRTKRGGSVIWGGIRDMQQIKQIKSIQTYYRGTDPTGIGEVILTGINTPCRIGRATCMPGDVVLGTISGVLFIPAHMAETCVVEAEKSHVRDIFGFRRLEERRYTTAQIDAAWTSEMMKDFLDWFETSAPDKYKHLTWDVELEEAKKREQQGPSGLEEARL